jgi:hypothetical protein
MNRDLGFTFKENLDAAQTANSDKTTQEHHAVVIAHSYGGMIKKVT